MSKFPRFPHYDGRRYYNPNAAAPLGFLEVVRWKASTRPEPSPRFINDVEPSVPPCDVPDGELRITLVNHSTVLLQQSGVNLLTDPVWSERASPLTWIGPRRRRIPGVSFKDLPRIDAVLISHNHYDHLDLSALEQLARRGRARFIVPLGVGALLESRGIGPVEELDWGGSLSLGGPAIHSVPALHFSARGLFDRNRTLWCGYVIQHGSRTVYFAGDTAYGWHFEAIRREYGRPDVALLPIGAYEPRWFMSAVHMGPEEALEAHQVLGADTSIGIHHGTFQLADDGVDTPRRLLDRSEFVLLRNGECWTAPKLPASRETGT